MKKLLIVFGSPTITPVNFDGGCRLVDNAEASGANGHKTDAIGY